MNVGYTSLIFFLVFSEYYILMTWNTGNEDNRNLPLVKKSKSPWGKIIQLGSRRKAKDKQKEDERQGTPKSSSTGTESSSAAVVKEYYTSELREDILRLFYGYQLLGAVRGQGKSRNWDRLYDEWKRKHGGSIDQRKLRSQAYALRDIMVEAGQNYDRNHLEEARDIAWTGILNDEFMKIYYATEAGDKSKHGDRMRDEWVRRRYSNYQNIKPKYLLKRAKVMLESAKRLSPEQQRIVNMEKRKARAETMEFLTGSFPKWKLEHDQYLFWLWEQDKKKDDHGRMARIYETALKRFSEFQQLSDRQVYERARYVWNRDSKNKQKEAVDREKMQETHIPYYQFIDEQSMPSMSQGTYHHHEWMAGTSFNPGISHQEPDLNLSLDIPYSKRQSPDTNPGLD